MKLLLPVASFLALVACTQLDANRGTYFTMANNTRVKMDFRNGKITHYEVEQNHNVPVWDAAGRMIGEIGAAGADLFIAHGVGRAVINGDRSGVQLITAAVIPTAQHVTNRPTNRVTPTPTPKP